MFKSIISALALSLAVAAPSAGRPYSVTKVANATAFFDNGECGYVYNRIPQTGTVQSFWRPAPWDGVFTWGYTMNNLEYNFVPAPCKVGGI